MAKRRQIAKNRRSSHQTQWAAQFAVASELCKRGYQVALTLGNHPVIDLMVISPKQQQFVVDVKGLYKPNFWPVRPKERPELLFYVFALVPDGAQNRFFVLTRDQVNEGIRVDWEDAKTRRKAKGLPGEPVDMKGVKWKFAESYENKWGALPP